MNREVRERLESADKVHKESKEARERAEKKIKEARAETEQRAPTVTFKLQDVIESTVKKQLEKNNQPHSSKDTSTSRDTQSR